MKKVNLKNHTLPVPLSFHLDWICSEGTAWVHRSRGALSFQKAAARGISRCQNEGLRLGSFYPKDKTRKSYFCPKNRRFFCSKNTLFWSSKNTHHFHCKIYSDIVYFISCPEGIEKKRKYRGSCFKGIILIFFRFEKISFKSPMKNDRR